MQLVQQVQEALVPFIVYKLRRITIHTHYFAINTGTDQSCVNERTLLRGEVEVSKDSYQVLSGNYLQHGDCLHVDIKLSFMC